MKKYYPLLISILFGCIILSGCGKVKNDQVSFAKKTEAPNSQERSNNSAAEDETDDAEVTATPVPVNATISQKQNYSDTERSISVIGLQEYKKLKGDKYTDKASKGKKYLVLFLEVINKKKEKEYFNVNYLTAKVDGKNIENTFLINDPEGYPTIFTNIQAGTREGGFIVWEVPENWKKLTVNYTGWKESDGLTLKCVLTKKNLKNPGKYSLKSYG